VGVGQEPAECGFGFFWKSADLLELNHPSLNCLLYQCKRKKRKKKKICSLWQS